MPVAKPKSKTKKDDDGKEKKKGEPPSTPNQENVSPATQECRQILVLYAQPLANTLMAYDMVKHLLEKVVIDSDKARLIRRMGKGQNAETNRQIVAELGTRGVREFEVFVEGIRKQEFSLLADLLEQKHFSRLINILDPVAKKLGHHWKRVALELGTGGFVVKIETKYEKVREQALYSLLIWEETSGVAATEKRLIDALDYCGMKWAIAYIRKLQGKGGKKKKGKKKGKGKKKK
ncbi:uncharacterized protein LOC581850 [Strongylocentrotus purpuratus]|uniref:Uncharacterized protein n=1 Tax=Strongylocentrotus purpuratus TaxID=7668 RepID=A0A7M7PQL8_STRPU|nr:uncharacterized protein LOC115929690 isoform X1 [Strongylocentrotus purpuratus]XP_800152.3 uncharacterized protein LOC581850 [Strongylocentrotus purpuratus]|eukprot:XP_800152.3 PREDICTED: uncharacterized protein LOC581850 [Strongylocentrotus purpuratus]